MVRYSNSTKAYALEKQRNAHLFADCSWKVHLRFPESVLASVIAAEAEMDLTPWDYWTYPTSQGSAWEQMGKGQVATPRENTVLAKEALEHAMELDPRHPGACHLYIHLMEASGNASKALACADKLVGLMPGSPHMNHMPSHIYIHTGDYQAGVLANEAAIAGSPADTLYPGIYTDESVDYTGALKDFNSPPPPARALHAVSIN
jgi:hypothetical protein